MAAGGFELSEEDVASVVALFDTDGSGSLRYAEFVAMLAAAASSDPDA